MSLLKTKDENLLKNDREVSFLPIFGKIFTSVILKDLINYFHHNELFITLPVWFILNYCCVSQLLLIFLKLVLDECGIFRYFEKF